MQATATAAKAVNRNSALDGLRFLAALSVVFFHLLATGDWGRPSEQVEM